MAHNGSVYGWIPVIFKIIFWIAENVIILGVQLHSNGNVIDVVTLLFL